MDRNRLVWLQAFHDFVWFSSETFAMCENLSEPLFMFKHCQGAALHHLGNASLCIFFIHMLYMWNCIVTTQIRWSCFLIMLILATAIMACLSPLSLFSINRWTHCPWNVFLHLQDDKLTEDLFFSFLLSVCSLSCRTISKLHTALIPGAI